MMHSHHVMAGISADVDCVDFESLTVSSSAIGLTATKVQPAGKKKRRKAIVQVTANQIRYRYDPSASALVAAAGVQAGPTAEATDYLLLDGPNTLSQIYFIATGSDAVLKVHYFE